MGNTEKNLLAAFAGESQANRKYLAFAKQADKEGFAQVARLFRAAAAAETVHAHAHLRAMEAVGSTADNLKTAIAGETYEFEKMYPTMIKEAEAEGHKVALRSFTYANEVEKVHAALYRRALEDLSGCEECDYYVCSVCGHTHEREAPEKCPVCGAKRSAFEKCQ
jgi:rubrerythrin